MKCKICGTNTVRDLEIAVAAGADAVGFIVGTTHKSDDSITPAEAKAMIRLLPPFVSGVVVTHLTAPLVVHHNSQRDNFLSIFKKLCICRVFCFY